MKTEYEARVLEIDSKKVMQKLEELGANKEGDWDQKRYVYQLIPPNKSKWIRLRTNGKETTITYKEIESKTIDGTKEIEFQVGDFEAAAEFFEKIGFTNRKYQENKRIRYRLDGVEVDIETWPKIPTYMEVEGASKEEVLKILEKLEINKNDITTLDVDSIFEHYGFDLSKIKELKFKEKK